MQQQTGLPRSPRQVALHKLPGEGTMQWARTMSTAEAGTARALKPPACAPLLRGKLTKLLHVLRTQCYTASSWATRPNLGQSSPTSCKTGSAKNTCLGVVRQFPDLQIRIFKRLCMVKGVFAPTMHTCIRSSLTGFIQTGLKDLCLTQHVPRVLPAGMLDMADARQNVPQIMISMFHKARSLLAHIEMVEASRGPRRSASLCFQDNVFVQGGRTKSR